MKEQLIKLKSEALGEIEKADSPSMLAAVKLKFVGKSGALSSIMRNMRDVAPEDRPQIGVILNEVRTAIDEAIARKEEAFNAEILKAKLEKEKVDITMPSVGSKTGACHPVYNIIEKIVSVCVGLGFEEVEGPEIESDYYNFEAMNVPKNHPARDMQDSFYFTDKFLLRTHTSPVQARVMEKTKPPIKVIVPGATYRVDDDSTHSPIFHQVEGLVVDEHVSMADLKALLDKIMKEVFGQDSVVRFRPSFFPFTEPSIEVDVSCPMCKGQGCRLCKGTGFLEMLGAGVVNPKVLEMSGIDSKKYRGIAFGTGIERPAMVVNQVSDMKTLFRNDIRFLEQLK